MPIEHRIRQLVEEALDSDRTPDEVCRDCPELLDDVRRQWERARAVAAEMDALFPRPDALPPDDAVFRDEETGLPRIEGYAVEAVLGRGGMGIVYRARHRKLNRPVALKMILAGAYASPPDRARFQREAEAVAALRHPNVVQVYDSGEAGGRPYFTMEFVEGGTLADKLAGTPLAARPAADLVAALAGAVQAAHACGVVHRDLKPANVLLTADGTPKVTDFGLARHVEGGPELTLSGTRVGTPSYMAPEQALGRSRAIGPASDIYALGVILYELLTGRPPFMGESAAETERQVIATDPVPPSRLNPRAPRDLETICLKCLHKDPARRYPSAAALADDLRRFLAGAPIAARRVGPLERAGKWVRRRPALTAALAGGVLLVVTVAGVGWWQIAERAAAVRATEDDLREAVEAERQSSWPTARTALERAKARLGGRDVPDLRARLDRAERALDLVARLDATRLKRATAGLRTFQWPQADRDYQTAFEAAGLGTPADPPGLVADRIRQTDVTASLVAALDDWALCTNEVARLEWVLAVARLADPGPAWHDRVRDRAVWADADALAALARDAPLDARSVPLLVVLGRHLDERGADAVGFLRWVHLAHPGDFWLNFVLAEVLAKRRNPDAIGYYRAALAVRPSAVAVYINLGKALDEQGRLTEAMDHWRHAVRVAPDATTAHHNLAVAHLRRSEVGQAVFHARRAVEADPRYGQAHAVLAHALLDQGRFAESADASDRALELLPRSDPDRNRATYVWTRSRRMLALAPRVAAVLRGTEPPADGREAAGFAELLYRTRRYAAAARMYADAFARDRALPDDADGRYRYDAACVAALAAAGAGDDAAQTEGPDQTSQRARAFAWLRAECNAWADRYERATPVDQLGVARELRRWLSDGDLAGVRDEALAALPEAERRPWQKLWTDVAGLAARDPDVKLEDARAQAARRQWAAATASYAQAFRLRPTNDGEAWFEYAAVQLLSGDRDSYRRTCAEMLQRSQLPGMRSYLVARACTLAPDAVPDLARVNSLSDREIRQSAAAFWSLTEKGALHYRAGRYQEAPPLLEKSLRAEPKPGAAVLNWLWLSLACQKLGRGDEARRWLDQAGDWLARQGTELPADAPARGLHLHNWLEAHVLRREAAEVLRAGP
jgi:serine/threonine-protein kinase